jgi:hypothetical protein
LDLYLPRTHGVQLQHQKSNVSMYNGDTNAIILTLKQVLWDTN